MAHWLLKTEPSDYSFVDLQKEKKTVWAGVSNALAKKHLRAMKAGDPILIYHTGKEKAVVGTATVLKEAGDSGEPTIAAGKLLGRPVTLEAIKKEKRFAGWGLVKIGRLSVVPTDAAIFGAILAMAEKV